MQHPLLRTVKSITDGSVVLKALATAVAATLVSACGITARLEPYKQTNAVLEEGDQVVVLARKHHATHEAEQKFVDCVSHALADGKQGIEIHDSIAFENLMYPWFEPSTAPLSTADLTELLEQTRRPGAGPQHGRAVRRLARRLDGPDRERRRNHVRGRCRRRRLHGPRLVGRRFQVRRDDLGHARAFLDRDDPCRRARPIGDAGDHHSHTADRATPVARVPRSYRAARAVPDHAARLRRGSRSRLARRRIGPTRVAATRLASRSESAIRGRILDFQDIPSFVMTERRDLQLVLRSGVPIIVIQTADEGRFLSLLSEIAVASPAAAYRPLFRWSLTDGLQRLDLDLEPQRHNSEPTDVLRHIRAVKTPGIYALLDFHPFLAEPVNTRLLKDIALAARDSGTVVLLISHEISLPRELESLSARFELKLPDAAERRSIVDRILEEYRRDNNRDVKVDAKALDLLVQNLAGLGHAETERLAHIAVCQDGAVTAADIPAVMKAKYELLNRGGILSLRARYRPVQRCRGISQPQSLAQAARRRLLGAATGRARRAERNPSSGRPRVR